MAHPFFWAALAGHVAVAAFVLSKGDMPERLGMATLLAAAGIQWALILVIAGLGGKPSDFEVWIDIGINIFASSAFTLIAVRFENLWITGALLMQATELALDGFSTQDGQRLHLGAAPAAYDILSLGVLSLLTIVTMSSILRRRAVTNAAGAHLAIQGQAIEA